ncbi:AraC family transcriptional regulator [Ruegeria sp. 2012CJ41-6]|uniref:AraC family transcriptional regulator n=1 Tax=Ruegeria spongiae TaxID=2942209 RepID=A0ABT0PXM8_9RHOB|nr:AraC family transcriptional regulator [Ruegeria spongiae]MCL6282368.1 AraC family transcriptional regulator [Ruegeria spongiae]
MDRLSALMSRFSLSVRPCAVEEANFAVVGDVQPDCLIYGTSGHLHLLEPDKHSVLLSARVCWGGSQNPLLAALPPEIRQDLTNDSEMRTVVDLLLAEQAAARCGSASVLNRLGEVLLVRLMRRQIEQGQMRVGLLGGLADPRLSRAIVAMHHRPGQDWRVDLLAQEAGLSVSRFAELFRKAVGVTPLAYLRKWRLTLARQDIERGDRVQRVANRYCYGSPEALSRAVSQEYGQTPTQIRKAAAEDRAIPAL